jgi:hypothetical protein
MIYGRGNIDIWGKELSLPQQGISSLQTGAVHQHEVATEPLHKKALATGSAKIL